MSRYALILASGTGSRAGGSVPKQFHIVAGRPLFYWSVRAFAEVEDVEVIAVVHPDYIGLWNEFWESLPTEEKILHKVVGGGASRIESVKCGISAIAEAAAEAVVAVHDAARPLVDSRMILDGFSACENLRRVAVPVVPVSDSLRKVGGEGVREGESCTVDRNEYVAVQTPQVAPLAWLRHAYSLEMKPWYTDDASILQAAGYQVALYPGSADNFKVTTPGDFIVADALLRARIASR